MALEAHHSAPVSHLSRANQQDLQKKHQQGFPIDPGRSHGFPTAKEERTRSPFYPDERRSLRTVHLSVSPLTEAPPPAGGGGCKVCPDYS